MLFLTNQNQLALSDQLSQVIYFMVLNPYELYFFYVMTRLPEAIQPNKILPLILKLIHIIIKLN
jgi:hypothetical protein